MDDCDFGRHLAYFRLSRGYTQVDLAQRTGLSARCISDLERGINAAPRVTTLRALADGLELGPKDRRRLLDVATCARLEVRFGRSDGSRPARRGRAVSAR